MSLALLALPVIALLALGYRFYGRMVARRVGLDDATATPAERQKDGVDYVPTRPFYLLGQHLSAIAAAGPIAGPILACTLFGWAPSLLWIALGVVLIGSVHDFTALVASVRHDGRSIAEIVKANLGRRAWLAILAFIWIALVYVIVAFADVTTSTFLGREGGLPGLEDFESGGAVAAASATYLLLALVMGFVVRFLRPPLWLVTAIFVPATLGAVWFGAEFPRLLLLSRDTWVVLIMGYCFVAALLPVWTLVQPRGYLGGFVLYLSLAVGVFGILFGGFEIRQAAFTGAPLVGTEKTALFPFLFVTIACGACSGFHGLVCSGTTAKQIARESHCRPVGYGAMLLEGFVALIALSTILIFTREETRVLDDPGTIYGSGLAAFLMTIIGEDTRALATTFGMMVFSTFIFDTLDVATRLGRYILQELLRVRGSATMLIGTALTAGVPLAILLAAGPGAWRTFWVLFGTSNQLLAGLTLLGVTVWLKRMGRPTWFTVLPMLFVMTITVWSLVLQAIGFFDRVTDAAGALQPAALANAVVTVLLLALAALLVADAVRAWRRIERRPAVAS
jgi:carbon starvation protein